MKQNIYKKKTQDNLNKQSAIEEGKNIKFLEIKSIYVRMCSSQKTR